jgi:hypothetical protein
MHDLSPHIPDPRPTRRDALRLAAGLGLSFLVPGLDLRAARERGPRRQKSLITLWMAGGPSQLETWDPHPGTRIGGGTRDIATAVPGLRIASLFARVADEIGSLSVIRSLVSKEGDHERGTYYLKTGYRPDPTVTHPSLGAIAANELPDTHVEIPLHVSLGPGEWPARGGFLGAEYDAFRIFDPGRNLENMRRPVEDERQRRRLENLDLASRAFRASRAVAAARTLHRETIDRALTMMSSEQLRAFDLAGETAATRAAYGDTQFGRGCLVARRLVEEGVRAVEVTLDGFDTHANNFDGHRENAAILDPAFASLIRDLRERELLDSTIVLCIGEFGRTPQINPLDGRDHWPTGFSCVVGGGGLRSGIVLGGTDPTGASSQPSDPVRVQDLFATILHVLGIDPEHEIVTPIGRPIRYSDGALIARLL